MDLGRQAHRVRLMIRDRGSNYAAAFGAVLAGAGIRTVLWNVRTPRMNANDQHWPHRSLHSAAALKPLPQPVVPGQYRVRRQTRAGDTINEYRRVARCG
jgi:hypothetical protein